MRNQNHNNYDNQYQEDGHIDTNTIENGILSNETVILSIVAVEEERWVTTIVLIYPQQAFVLHISF